VDHDAPGDPGSPGAGGERDPSEAALVADLRAGGEDAFAALIDRYYDTMIRVARLHVATPEAAEDVVQETFLGVIRGLDRFEGRSSLKTWIFRILVNQAKSRGQRDKRSQPFSSVLVELSADEPAVAPERFLDSGRWRGYWQAPPSAEQLPEVHALASEVGDHLLAAIDALPTNQRLVITLRDVQGFSSAEVCQLMAISEANQRVLLHRARSKPRATLERHLDEPRAAVS
jgi:RNA polymerase sigma-70 factor (ECF subfamily)